MPQFDTQWYLSEILWFLLCFGVLYLVMAYFIYPLIQDIFLEREHKIKNDLSVAEVINKQAAKLIQNYKTRIYSAEQVKTEIINETYRIVGENKPKKGTAFVELNPQNLY
jgi:F-type H+-transporting ATPase subunit b